MKKYKWVVPTLYIIFLMLPIYWLLNMSFKTTTEIINVYSLWPQDFKLDNYKKIFTDSTWYMGYVNSITYTVFNTIISVSAALPAAYAFSRYKFLGDKHLFFWLLTNRMAPPAVFALPFFQFYSSVNLFDTHIAIALSHCLFNIPLAVWILEGFMSAVPKGATGECVSALRITLRSSAMLSIAVFSSLLIFTRLRKPSEWVCATMSCKMSFIRFLLFQVLLYCLYRHLSSSFL